MCRQADYPDLFVRFACADPAGSRALDVLRGNIKRGAIGFGELKFPVAVELPEVAQVYKLAGELRCPLLIIPNFQYETYDTGLERFAAVLKAYPNVTFIGHAQTWWGNISAELNPVDLYPKGPVRPGGLTDRLLADYPNIYGDLSADSGLNAMTRDPDFARGFIERHSRKLLWGSDCNCVDGKGAVFQRDITLWDAAWQRYGSSLPAKPSFAASFMKMWPLCCASTRISRCAQARSPSATASRSALSHKRRGLLLLNITNQSDARCCSGAVLSAE